MQANIRHLQTMADLYWEFSHSMYDQGETSYALSLARMAIRYENRAESLSEEAAAAGC